VITENCGIAPLLVGVAGLVVPHNAEAMSRAIARVLTEPALCAQLSAGCKQATSRLGWEEPAQEMEASYRQLVGSESRVS
jgi:glycosyltransferase involved in cell wall biosynthesis